MNPSPTPPPDPASPDRKRAPRGTFWRACRFLWPYRTTFVFSVIAAFIAGAAFTSGLSAALPIMRILINGDTLTAWADRWVVESRLSVRLIDDPQDVRVVSVREAGPAAEAGVKPADRIELPGLPPDLAPRERAARILSGLADPAVDAATVRIGGRDVAVRLSPVSSWQVAMRSTAAMLPTDPIRAIAVVFAAMLALAIFGNLVRFFQEYYSDKVGILAVSDLRRRFYDHAMRMPLAEIHVRGTSDLASRLTVDASILQEGFRIILGRAIQEPIKAGMALGFALLLSWQLTLVMMASGPILYLFLHHFGRRMRRAARRALQSSADALGQIEPTFAGIRAVKAASAERSERRKYETILRRIVDEFLKLSRIDAASAPILESMTLILSGAVVLYAAYLVLVARVLSADTFIMVLLCLVTMGESLRRVSKLNNTLQRANAAAARMFDVIDADTERSRSSSASLAVAEAAPRTVPRKLQSVTRDIVFDDVCFTYPGGTTPAIDHVSLAVPRGQSVAVVGRNGSGKTTLMAMLPLFYRPQSGRILIDGVDTTTVTLRSLRRQITVVTQDAFLFPGTLAQNIAYGYSRVDRDAVEDAARRAFAHDFITAKPGGYDTVVSEISGQLSGGQRQRLCIARAIYRKSPILILDEATSQVDTESESLIQQAIQQLLHERTTFVIAHRFSTITSADRIVLMEQGRIVADGTHAQLLAGNEIYRTLYERQ